MRGGKQQYNGNAGMRVMSHVVSPQYRSSTHTPTLGAPGGATRGCMCTIDGGKLESGRNEKRREGGSRDERESASDGNHSASPRFDILRTCSA